MSNSYFQFKQFTIHQDKCAMKVTTDGCLFGAWVAEIIKNEKLISKNCLDIGTGTGLLALMVAQKNNCRIDAVEIDKESAEQAASNAAASPWSDRINVIHADILKVVLPGSYDMIISNPPFYENELKGDDPKKNTAHHDEGLLLPELLNVIKQQLTPGGRFFLMLPYKRNEEVKELLLKQQVHIRRLVFVKPSSNHSFIRIFIEGALLNDEAGGTSIDEICIKEETSLYSSAFTQLLKEYYLHL